MISVSIQELKQRLSELIRKAANGERVLITRHNKPVAYLSSSQLRHLHVGRGIGNAKLRPLLQNATRGAYLRVLQEDRRGER